MRSRFLQLVASIVLFAAAAVAQVPVPAGSTIGPVTNQTGQSIDVVTNVGGVISIQTVGPGEEFCLPIPNDPTLVGTTFAICFYTNVFEKPPFACTVYQIVGG